LILYRKAPQLRVTRAEVPEPPYWAATIVAPYGARRAAPVAVDYLDLRATRGERLEVAVSENVRDELERLLARQPLHEPLLVDAAEGAEVVFRRADEVLEVCREQDVAASVLISTRGALPRSSDAIAVIAAWPPELPRLEALFDEARARELRWGVAVPLIFPVTTNLDTLARLAQAAHGASFFASLPVELDATARKAIAETHALDEESYDLLFHADPEPVLVATERHVAALAAEIGAADFITPPGWERRANWNAGVLLTLAATRMLAMKHEVETAWRMIRSARAVAQLEKPLVVVAAAARLSIIEAVDLTSVDVLTEWLESGRSAFVEHVNKQWRLRRDGGV
jgi:hypothetical protein